MAIQLRRGNETDLDISRLQPGETAVCLDTGKIIVKLTGGNYLTLTDTDAIQEIVAGKAAASHTHGQSDVTGLVDALAGKAAASHTHPAMTGADSNTAGTAGLVPAPAAGDNGKFLRGDGTWVRSLTIDQIYPVGSIYMSVNSTSPSTLFGGTWERLKDTFLLAAGDAYSAGATGGEAAHLLTNDELPADMGSFSALNWNHLTQQWNNTTGIVSTTIRTQDRTMPTGDAVGANTYNLNGGGQAHNNMPPYLTVYMWKRTA